MKRPNPDQGSLLGYIHPVTGTPQSHAPLCSCGQCSTPVEMFAGAMPIHQQYGMMLKIMDECRYAKGTDIANRLARMEEPNARS